MGFMVHLLSRNMQCAALMICNLSFPFILLLCKVRRCPSLESQALYTDALPVHAACGSTKVVLPSLPFGLVKKQRM